MPPSGLTIDIAASPAELGDSLVRDRAVVVIDVLRATSVIGAAMEAGAARIIPVATVDEALERRARLDPEPALLCGERGGHRVPGFDIGNSPLEYTPSAVAGRTLILASSNGTVVLSRCAPAARVLIGSFNNLSAVARAMVGSGGAWILACSGKLGRACLEDLVCAGLMARRCGLRDSDSRSDIPADADRDGLALGLALADRLGGDPLALLRNCAHGRYLAAIGYAADLEHCARIDLYSRVPELAQGRITAGPAVA